LIDVGWERRPFGGGIQSPAAERRSTRGRDRKAGEAHEQVAGAAGVLTLDFGDWIAFAHGRAAGVVRVGLDHRDEGVDGAGEEGQGPEADAGGGKGFEIFDGFAGVRPRETRGEVRERALVAVADLLKREIGAREIAQELGEEKFLRFEWHAP
jgi:hypothetical protein